MSEKPQFCADGKLDMRFSPSHKYNKGADNYRNKPNFCPSNFSKPEYDVKVNITGVPKDISEKDLNSIFENCEITEIDRESFKGKIKLTLKYRGKFKYVVSNARKHYQKIFVQPSVNYFRIAIIENEENSIDFKTVQAQFSNLEHVIWIFDKKKNYYILFDSEDSCNAFLNDRDKYPEYKFITQDERQLNRAIADMQNKIYIDNIPESITRKDIYQVLKSYGGISKSKLEKNKAVFKFESIKPVTALLKDGSIMVKDHKLDICIHLDPKVTNTLQDPSNPRYKEFEDLLVENPAYIEKINSPDFDRMKFLKDYLMRKGVIGQLNELFIATYISEYNKLTNGVPLLKQICDLFGKNIYEQLMIHLEKIHSQEEHLKACDDFYNDLLSEE